MFSLRQKREISEAVQKILRNTNHPELPKGEINLNYMSMVLNHGHGQILKIMDRLITLVLTGGMNSKIQNLKRKECYGDQYYLQL